MLPSWLSSVHHDGSEKYVSNPFPRLGETVYLYLRLGRDAPVKGVYLRSFPDGEQLFATLSPGPVEPACRWWQVSLVVSQPAPDPLGSTQ